MRRILGPILGLALVGVLAAAPATANPFPDTIDLPDGWQPEGITSNGTTLYVGSLGRWRHLARHAPVRHGRYVHRGR